MDGYDTAEWLVKHHSSVKILALSMYDDELSVIRMFRSGARGYILKDAQPGELEQALDQLVRRGYYHPDFVAEMLMKNSGVSLAQKELNQPFLTERERDFLRLACSEQTYKEIADQMCLSVRTIDGYREELFGKLQVKSRTGLVLYAIKQRIICL
jgi:DNA-binding NarL/FixJ family response regulator